MGRIIKEAVISHGVRIVRVHAKVDSGADVTLLAADDADRIGFDQCQGREAAVSGITRESKDDRYATTTRLCGREFTVTIRIDDREATIAALVPLWQISVRTDKQTGKEKVVSKADGRLRRSLIGHDFLQASRAKLDYSVPHSQAFSGVLHPAQWPDWTVHPVSKAEQTALRKLSKCPKKRARR